eukprot:1411340-Prymnesium_polylepis.2
MLRKHSLIDGLVGATMDLHSQVCKGVRRASVEGASVEVPMPEPERPAPLRRSHTTGSVRV